MDVGKNKSGCDDDKTPLPPPPIPQTQRSKKREIIKILLYGLGIYGKGEENCEGMQILLPSPGKRKKDSMEREGAFLHFSVFFSEEKDVGTSLLL